MMTTIIQWFTEPFITPFMQNALWVACVLGVVCAVLSCFLVLRGWSLMGDAISHAVLPGIALAEVIGLAHAVGAFFSGLACALLTGLVGQYTRLKEDTVLGIVFSSLFAIGLIMVAQIETSVHLLHIIQGNLLGMRPDEMRQVIVIACVVLAVMAMKWKDFLLYCFDATHARAIGLPVKRLHYALLILLALTIVAAIQAVGVIMVVALLIAPGITGFVLSKRFAVMMGIAVLSALFSAFLGVVISYHSDAATSACIVLVHGGVFIGALLLKNGYLAVMIR